jgi:hypothetical protein
MNKWKDHHSGVHIKVKMRVRDELTQCLVNYLWSSENVNITSNGLED